MSTTLVFVELLAAGVLATASLMLAAFGLGFEPQLITEKFSQDGRLVLGIALVAFVYVVGVIVDGLADRLFSAFDDDSKRMGKLRRKYNLQERHSLFSLTLAKRSNEFVEAFFEYTRVRIRLLRSFMLNAVLLALTGLCAAYKWHDPVSPLWYVVWPGLWLGLAYAAWFVYWKHQNKWHKTLAICWKRLPPESDAPQNTSGGPDGR